MSAPQAAPAATQPVREVVNDFVLKVGTVNGSGSQTANMVLLRSLFQTGIPCSGKNVFPSNIAGLPTWFEIRTSPRGYLARRRGVDVLVAMNFDTAKQDLAEVLPGGAVVYDAPMNLAGTRADVAFYPVPFGKIIQECCPEARLRRLVTNMIYVGVVAHLLGIEPEEVDRALVRMLGAKKKALELNRGAIAAGAKYAAEHLPKRDGIRASRPAKSATAGKILMDGNAAAALGAMFGGVTVFTWYPITPSSSLGEALHGYLEKYRRDPATGKATYAVIQAEDELAAAGMALGAGWAGARSMTATSGPGISLMAEFVGFGYYAEIPCVIFDIQRVGPSTGLPTRTAQGDILEVAFLSHGDTKHPMLFPCSIGEAFAMAQDALDLAERFQTPVFVMSDLDLGMNLWPSDPFPCPTRPLDRGKVLSEEALRKLGKEGFGRYADVDGDGVPYRTLPGTPGGLGSYFTRGSGHDAKARYTEDAKAYEENVDRLARKFETIRATVPKAVCTASGGRSEAGVLAFGTTHWAMVEALDVLRETRRMSPDYLRLLAWPFGPEVREFLASHERVYVAEQNRDGQLAALLRMEYPDLATRVRSVLHYDGFPMDAAAIVEGVAAGEGGAR